MSNDKTHNVTSLPDAPETKTDVVPEPNWLRRNVITPIKEHPKAAVAVLAGAALVAGAALTGRKSAQYDVVLELQPAEMEETETVTLIDTTSA